MVGLASPVAATPCEIATITWDGDAGTTSWGDASNWTGNVLPGPSDHVCVNASSVSYSLSGVSIRSLEAKGTLSLNSSLSITDPTVESNIQTLNASGSLGGDATIVVGSYANWTSGSLVSGGHVRIAPGATLNAYKVCCSAMSLGAGTIDNQGTLLVGGYGFSMQSGALIDNSGTLDFQSGNYVTISDGSGADPDPLIINTGTIIKTGTNSNANGISVPIDNDGLVTTEAAASALPLNGGSGGRASSGTYSGKVNLSGSTSNPHMLAGAILMGTHTVGGVEVPEGATTTLQSGMTTLSGTLGGRGTFLVSGGSLAWAGGTMTDGGVTRVAPGGTLYQAGGCCSPLVLGSRTIDNEGTMAVASHGLSLTAGALIDNSGTLDFQSGNYVTISDGSGADPDPLIINTGTIIKTGTNSNANGISVPIDNDGLVTTEAAASALPLNGGSGGRASSGTYSGKVYLSGSTSNPHILGGATFTGGSTKLAGYVEVATGESATLASGATTQLDGGTLGGSGTFVVDGTLNWAGGTMKDAGMTRVSSTGRIALEGWCCSSASLQANRTITNAGTFFVSGNGLTLYDNARIDNSGTLEYSSSGSSSLGDGSTTTKPLINNTGTVIKVGSSTGTKSISVPLDNDGVVTAAAGAGRLSLSGGSVPGTTTGVFGDRIDIPAGTYNLDGASFTGAVTISGGTTAINVSGATPSTVSPSGAVTFSSGTIAGTGTLSIAGTLIWSGGTMADSGITHVASSGTLTLANSSAINLQAGRSIVNDGTLGWSGSGTLNAYADTRIDNYGLFDITSNVTLANQAGVGTRPYLINRGTVLKRTGTSTTTLAVSFENVADGTIDVQTGTLSVTGVLNNYSPTRRTLTGGIYRLKGALRFPNADIATNDATIVLDGTSASLTDSSSQSGLRNLARNNSSGSLELVGGKSLTVPAAFVNQGSLTIGPGSTFTSNGAFTQGEGKTTLADVGSKLVAGGSGVSLQGGVLSGVGTVQAALSNSATILPAGTGAGTLTVTGAYSQGATGSLVTDIASATSSDRLAVSGNATLDGTLEIVTATGLTPPDGTRYSLVTHGSRSGFFSNVVGTELSPTSVYKIRHEAGSVDALVEAATSRDWGAVSINSGAAYSNTRNVTLILTVPDPSQVSGMRIANDAPPTGSYQAFSPSVAWTLANSDGERTVYVQFRDVSGNQSLVQFDSITLDRIAPTVTITAPPSPAGAVTFSFSEPVTGATDANAVLRATATAVNLAATLVCKDDSGTVVSCATDQFTTLTLQPTAPLLPATSYTATANPTGAASLIADVVSNAVALTSKDFTVNAGGPL